MRRLMLYDRLGSPLGELPEGDVFAATLHEEINGEHSLEITTTHVLGKGSRLLCQDGRGKWREFAVSGVDAEHASGNRAIGTYYCTWSVQQDLQGVTVSVMPGVQSPVNASTALNALLSATTRWQRGTVTNTKTGGASMYDRSAWQAMSTLVEVWGGEVDTTIEVDTKTGVTARKVDLYDKQGEQTAKRRFDFGCDLKSVKRVMADEPLYCRISPRGKGEQTDGGGYGRKITIEDVNAGKDYLTYTPMVDAAKLPDGNGGYEYPTLIVENSKCETPQALKEWAQGVLSECCTPQVSYKIDVLQAGVEGVDFDGVSLGDAVHVVDGKFGSGGLRVEGRVTSIVTDLLNERDVTIEIGSTSKSIANQFKTVSMSIAEISNTITSMSTAEYIDALLDRINAEINATGGYTYITEGQGLRTYDAAVSDPLVGAEATKVVEIKGGSIRIANSRTAQGEWEWRSVFTSGRIAADMVTAAQLTTGYIGNPNGNYWNLDSGELRMSLGGTLGDSTVEEVLDAIDAAITETDVEYAQGTSTATAPTSGWSTTAPQWEAGKYIWTRTKTVNGNGTSYSDPVCISGRDGQTGTNAAAVYLYTRVFPWAVSGTTLNVNTAGDLTVSGTTATVSAANVSGTTLALTQMDVADPLTYTFASGMLSGNLGSWSRSIPAGTDACYVSMATAVSNSASDTIARAEWSEPVALSTAGVDGLNQATVFLFQRAKEWEQRATSLVAPSASAFNVSGTTATMQGSVSCTTLEVAETTPDKPNVATSYTFASGELSPIPSGWSRSVPDGEATCYVTTAAAISAEAIDSIEASEWAEVTKLVGEPESGAVYSIQYAIGTSGTTAPTTGWQSTVPATPQGGWLWCRTTFVDNTTSDTCSYVGTDGQDGISVYVQSAVKVDGVTTVKLVDTEGNETTMTIADGDDGENGAPGASGYVHVAWANSADGATDFSTSVSTDKAYIGVYTDNTEADSQEPSDYNWSRIRGEDGLNQTSIILYKRSASQPSGSAAAPSGSTTYSFVNHALTGNLNGWSQSIPTGTDPCWAIAATASSNTDTDTIAASEWAQPPVKLVADGAAGLNQATVFLYQRYVGWSVSGTTLNALSASAVTVSGTTATIGGSVSETMLTVDAIPPDKPQASSTYTFASGNLSPVPSGWSRTVPSGTMPCWVTTAAAISSAGTDTIAASDWAGVVKFVENGAKGADGVGISGVTEQYARNNSSSTPPTSWQATVVAPTSSERYVWNREIMQYTDGTQGQPTTPHVVAVFGENGNDGRGIASITNYYAISASNSTAPADSEFTTSVKTPTDSKPYLWNYELIAYTTGNPTMTAKHVVGAQGVGIAGVVEEYARNNSSTDAPTSGWGTGVLSPTPSERYVWNRESMRYTNGTTGNPTAAHVAAVYGETGKGIASITNYYAINNSLTAPGDSSFSTTVKTPTKANPYLWNYEVVAYTTGNPTTTAKHIVGKYGDTGVGVSAIEEQYYLSTSSSTQTGGSWSTAQPTWESGKYIWTRSKVTWTDGSTPSYTDPVLAKAINGANSTAKTAKDTADTAKDTADACDAILNGNNRQMEIFNRLTNNGAAQGLYTDDGQLYINGTYMVIGKISSQNGRVYFDLDNNELACNKLWAPQPGTTVGDVVLTARNTAQYSGSYFTFLNIYNTLNDTDAIRIHPARGGWNSAITTIDSNLLIAAMSDSPDGRGATKGGLLQLKANEASLTAYPSGSSTTNASVYCSGSQNCVLLGTVKAGSTQCAQLTVTGSKSRLVETDGYSDRLLYCDETPSPTFTDFGSGTIGADGLCYVEIDAVFAETVRTDMTYQVFLQACGRGELWVNEKTPTYFVVSGAPGLAFDWQIKAHQTGFETLRLEDNALSEAIVPEELPNPEDAYGDYIAELEELLAA